MELPNVWGGGQLFAYSGVEGETDWYHPFVAKTLPDKLGLSFFTEAERRLWITINLDGVVKESLPGRGETAFKEFKPEVVSSDLIDAAVIPEDGYPEVRVTYLFLNKDVIIGRVVWEGEPTLEVEPKTTIRNGEEERRDGATLQRNEEENTALVVSGGDGLLNFAYSFDPTDVDDAYAKALSALKEDIDEVYERKVGFFKGLPRPEAGFPNTLLERTYYKAFSVLKVNVESPVGRIPYHWTTPDRFPHRYMWLWDSAFQAQAYKYISPRLGEEAIMAVLSTQREDGFISHRMGPGEKDTTRFTQPPILAWATWDIYRYTRNKSFLEYCYPRLKGYILWDLRNRNYNKRGLLAWMKVEEAHPISGSRGGESGMDNSPRFDGPGNDDAVDFNSFIANDLEYLAKIAEETGYTEEAELWASKRRELIRLINKYLWDDEDHFYYDLNSEGEFVKVKTAASFTTLFAGVARKEQAEELIKHLTNPEEFWTPFPVATVSRDEPTFSKDMWRGPVWINYNYLTIEGLERYGYHDIARELAAKTLDWMAYWYEKTGVIWEYYDWEGKVNPRDLPRKGGVGEKGGLGFGVIGDYNWSAAVYIILTLKYNRQ